MRLLIQISLLLLLFGCATDKKDLVIESSIPEKTIKSSQDTLEFEYFGKDTLYSSISIKSFLNRPDQIKISASPRSCQLHLGQILQLSDSGEFCFIPDQSIYVGVHKNYHWGDKKLSFFGNGGCENLFAYISNAAGTIDTTCILAEARTIIDFTNHPAAIEEDLTVALDFRDHPEIEMDTFTFNYVRTGLEIRSMRFFDTLRFSIDSSKITLHNYHEKSTYRTSKKDTYYLD